MKVMGMLVVSLRGVVEIIKLKDELLVLKIEHMDWLNYIGMMDIVLQHLSKA